MPLTYTRTFRIRFYECDAYGHLNNANYLRYMQETAFDASTAAGYDLQRYNQIGRLWLVRESSVEYLIPLHYNDQVEIKTWVIDFRRASSRRVYEFYRLPERSLAARAYTDWVLIDMNTNRAASVPAEMGAAFFPEGIPENFPPREPFPQLPTPPPGVFRMRRSVAWQDLDQMQHVNNAVYLNYISECGMQVLKAHRWPWERMVEAGFAIFLRRSWIQYLQPAVLDDELEIATWASEMRRATAMRHYTIQRARDGVLLARVHTLGAWVDVHSGQPIRIPKGFVQDFEPNIVGESS